MSKKFIIQGGKSLRGSISVAGAKNAALALLAASLVTDKPCHFYNLPDIADVKKMTVILKSLGAEIKKLNHNELIITAKTINPKNIDLKAVGKIRASIMIMGALAARINSFTLAYPGGCQIGSRSLDAHLNAFLDAGFKLADTGNALAFTSSKNFVGKIVLTEFSPTATVNLLLALSRGDKPVTIYCAAQDYTVQEVCWFLKKLGVTIDGVGTHTITIQGIKKTKEADYTIMPDPIETGTLILLAAATHSSLTILNASLNFLKLELKIFKKIGIKYNITNQRAATGGHYELVDINILKTKQFKAVKEVHNMPAPGFMPDLLQPLSVLLTQAQGTSIIHDWMYEGRFRHLNELNKMGANTSMLDPHRAVIIGPTPLYGKRITSYDLRAGATLIIAALIAQGESQIDNIYQVDRGYEKIDLRLKQIGAEIKRL